MDKAVSWEESAIFAQWFFENWIACGGLITKKTTADLFAVTQARITYLINSGKLRVHKYDHFEFLELAQVKQMHMQRLYKRLKQGYEETAALLPEKERESFLKQHIQILDYQLHCIEPFKKAACNITSITKKPAGDTPATPKKGKRRKRK